MSGRRQPLYLTGATTLEAAMRALMDLDDVCIRCVVSSAPAVATLAATKGHPDRVSTTLAAYLRERFGESVVITPPTLGRALLGREPWMRVALDRPEVRLREAQYPAVLFAHEMLFACIDLERPLAPGERPVVAAGLWARFAKPMQRLGALLSDEREGLAAELALGIVARRYIAVGMVDGIAIAISSPDPIAAELAGRALLVLRGDALPGQPQVGPWETGLVQRAMEIGLGQVRSPEQLAPVTRWEGPSQRERVFTDVLGRMADLLSIPRAALGTHPTTGA